MHMVMTCYDTHTRAKINWLAECLLRASHLDRGKGQDAKRNAADRNKSDDPIGPIPRSSLGNSFEETLRRGPRARKPGEETRGGAPKWTRPFGQHEIAAEPFVENCGGGSVAEVPAEARGNPSVVQETIENYSEVFDGFCLCLPCSNSCPDPWTGLRLKSECPPSPRWNSKCETWKR